MITKCVDSLVIIRYTGHLERNIDQHF